MKEPEPNLNYDMLIIGAGISGLSTGLAWQKLYPHSRVLILEKNAVPGGCVSTFARKGFRFDTVQIIPEMQDLLEYFGVDIPLIKYQNNCARLILIKPGLNKAEVIPVPDSAIKFKEYLCHRFPLDSSRIQRFFGYCTAMEAELKYLKTEPAWYQLPALLFRCRRILWNSRLTYRSFVKKFGFQHPDVEEILDVFSYFSGLSGDRCSALLTACAMITTLRGSYRTQKGFITFPLALAEKFISQGGQIMYNTKAEKILINGKYVAGVGLSNGGANIFSRYVVNTADTRQCLGGMLGYPELQKLNRKYAQKAGGTSMSPSMVCIHLGLSPETDLKKMGFDCGYNVVTTGMQAHRESFTTWEKGRLPERDEQFHFAVISPSAATGGPSTLIIHIAPVSADYWITLRRDHYREYLRRKEEFAAFYIEMTEKYLIPDLRNQILFADISTPATFEKHLGSPTGSTFDMMPLPSNFGKNRLRVRTPLRNFFHAKFSHGIWPCMQAGLQITDMISGGRLMNGNASWRKDV